ncbi:MAG: hypothetical protein NTZ49_00390 [Candidatus Parcubacteria bacterium]|nr:hypothetical protein [Candidatus Parcubacteria bacterium]
MEHARVLVSYGAEMSAQTENNTMDNTAEGQAQKPKQYFYRICFQDMRTKGDHKLDIPADDTNEALEKAEKLLQKKDANPDTIKIYTSEEYRLLGQMATFYVYYSHYEGERFCRITIPLDSNYNQMQQKARTELFKRLGKMPTRVVDEKQFKRLHAPRNNRYRFFFHTIDKLFIRNVKSVIIEAPNAIEAVILFRQKYGRQPISWEYA